MGSALPLGVEVADVLGEVAAVGVAVVEPVREERCCLVKVSVRDTVAVEEAEGEGVEEALPPPPSPPLPAETEAGAEGQA